MDSDNVDELINEYNSVLSELLDKHASLIRCTVTGHLEAPWITETIKKQKTWKEEGRVKMAKDRIGGTQVNLHRAPKQSKCDDHKV